MTKTECKVIRRVGFLILSLMAILLLMAGCAVGSSQSTDQQQMPQITPIMKSNETGTNNGFYYSCWTNDKGTVTYQNQAAGRYTVSWNSNGASGFNFTCGKGWSTGDANRVVNYTGTFNPGNNGFLALYGWAATSVATPQSYCVVEYYVIESYGNWTPPGSVSSLGQVTTDGGTYNIYKTTRTSQPWIVNGNNGTFNQYWSVRTPKKATGSISGTITFKKHLDAWKSISGMNEISALSYYQIMETEGYESTGNADITVSTGSSSSKTWQTLGTGTNGNVNALVCNGSTLYAGGSFTTAGGYSANRVASYSNNTWSSLNSTMDNLVETLAYNPSSGSLYVGGWFSTPSPYFARYKNSAWSGYGTGMNGYVYALAYGSNKLYAGGAFSSAGSTTGVNSLAQWNGTTWSAVGSFGTNLPNGGFDPQVKALTCDSSGALYVSWSYYVPSGHGASTVNTISKWSNSTWTSIGTPNDFVGAMACSGTTLYVGGGFTTVGSTTAHAIAKYSNGSWSALGSGISGGWVKTLICDSSGNLYVGGAFGSAGGVTANNIALYSNGTWSTLGSGTNSAVNALAIDSSGNLYAGGWFTTPGNYIAVWK